MKIIKFFVFPLAIFLLAPGCSDDEQKIDKEYPEIILSDPRSFPSQCSVIERGKTFTFRAVLSDNAELGSLSIDIHHNFDHHTHSTEVEDCKMDAVKKPEKPFLLIKNLPIPPGQKAYEASFDIQVPSDVDRGDYHFLIRVTDKEGWQTIKGLSIKID